MTRVVVYIVEIAGAHGQNLAVSWHKVPHYSKKELKEFYVMTRFYKAKLLEAKEKIEKLKEPPAPATNESGSSLLKEIKGMRDKSKTRKFKSIDLAKLLPDNKNSKPVLILFTSDKNLFCQYLTRVVLTNKAIKEKIDNNFFPVKILYDEEISESEFALYKVYYQSPVIPAMIVLTEDGISLKKLTGLPDSIGLDTFLDKSLEEYRLKKKEELLDKKLKDKDHDPKDKNLQ